MQLRKLRDQFPDELVVIGVHSAKFTSEQNTENIRQAVLRHGIEHPVVNDAGFKVWNAYAVRAWPTLVLIDPNGRIAGEVSGEILAEDMAKEIEEVIRSNPDAVDRTPLDLSTPAGMAVEPERPLRYPAKLLLSGDRLFISDTGHHRVLEIRMDEDGLGGEIQRVFGSGTAGLRDGTTEQAQFSHPHGLGLDGDPSSGTLYVADTENHAIRAVDLSNGDVRTVAGTGEKAHRRTALGEPTQVPLRSPWSVLPLGEYLLIAMAGSHQIWVLINGEQIGPFAGNGVEDLVDGPVAESSFNQPSDLAFGMGYLFVADPEASAVRAISLNENPTTHTVVGQGLFDWGDVDGPTSTALLQHPVGLDVSGALVYVTDTYNHKIKEVDPVNGQVRTLIGTGKPGMQDGAFDQVQLFEPEGIQAGQGRLYIADTNNHVVRVADLQTRQVSTFRLRGVEKLARSEGSGAPLQQLPTVLAASGSVRIALDIRLPEGYKRNPDAPALLRLKEEDRPISFDAEDEIAWQVELDGPRSLPVGLTLYYCQEGNAGLCLIHDARLEIPLEVVPGGPVEVRVPYNVNGIG